MTSPKVNMGTLSRQRWNATEPLTNSRVVTLGNEIRRLSAEIQNLSRRLSRRQPYGSTHAINEESEHVHAAPDADHVDDAEPELANDDVQSTMSLSWNDYNREGLDAFWVSHCPNEDECSDLMTMFIDFVKYGRPARNIQGIRNRFNPSVSDDLSTTILIFGQTDINGETRWQPVSWAPDDDVVAVRESWDKINQNIRDKWPSSLKPAGIGEEGSTSSGRDPNDFAYGWDSTHGASVDLTRFSYSEDGSPESFSTESASIAVAQLGPVLETSLFQAPPAWANQVFGRRWYACLELP
jgi:hypothetical protein